MKADALQNINQVFAEINACQTAAYDECLEHSNVSAYLNTLTAMGQRPCGTGSPAGYKDTATAWDGSDALVTRIDWVNRWVERIPQTPEPLSLTDHTLNWLLTQSSQQVVNRAERRQQGWLCHC